MSNFRDEIASRLFVGAIAKSQGHQASDLRSLAHQCLEEAQVFAEAVCHDRDHEFHLVRWLEGHAPSAPGRPSGAPRGVYACARCGHEEERTGQ
jgi:hypothetical protein